jgi:hypothetical protein
MVVRVKENSEHPNKILEKQRKIKLQRKTVQRKLIISLRRSPTLLCHPELEEAFSAGVHTTSLFLFGGPCERSTPFRLRPYEFPIFRTSEIPFVHCSHKYFSLNLLLS